MTSRIIRLTPRYPSANLLDMARDPSMNGRTCWIPEFAGSRCLRIVPMQIHHGLSEGQGGSHSERGGSHPSGTVVHPRRGVKHLRGSRLLSNLSLSSSHRPRLASDVGLNPKLVRPPRPSLSKTKSLQPSPLLQNDEIVVLQWKRD